MKFYSELNKWLEAAPPESMSYFHIHQDDEGAVTQQAKELGWEVKRKSIKSFNRGLIRYPERNIRLHLERGRSWATVLVTSSGVQSKEQFLLDRQIEVAIQEDRKEQEYYDRLLETSRA